VTWVKGKAWGVELGTRSKSREMQGTRGVETHKEIGKQFG
jgi:hypothetical protein